MLHMKLVAQVDFTDPLIVQHVLGGAGGNNVSFSNDIGLFANVQRVSNIMVGNQHADAAIAQVIDDFLDVYDRNGVHSLQTARPTG